MGAISGNFSLEKTSRRLKKHPVMAGRPAYMDTWAAISEKEGFTPNRLGLRKLSDEKN